MRAFARLAVLASLVSLVACASSADEPSNEDFCEEAEIAAASRTMECTGDETLSNDVGGVIGDDARCTDATLDGGPPNDPRLECAENLLETPCASVPDLSADPLDWLAGTQGCELLFTNLPAGGVE
jgi:hypothetical protein